MEKWLAFIEKLNNELKKELAEHEEFTKKAQAEIERLTEEANKDTVTHIDLCTENLSLRKQNAELQKQLDELTEQILELIKVCDNCPKVITDVEQAVKDTAKEVLQEVENLLHECAMEYANAGHKDYFGICENISWKVVRKIAKDKGVEVY